MTSHVVDVGLTVGHRDVWRGLWWDMDVCDLDRRCVGCVHDG